MDKDLRIRMLFEAMDKVTAPLKAIAGGSKQAAAALKATRDRLKEVDQAQSQIGEFRKLKQGIGDLDERLGTARTRVAALARQIGQTDGPTKKLASEFAKAKREAASLGDQHREQSERLQVLRTRLQAAGVSTRDLVNDERRLRTEASGLNDQLAEQERRLKSLSQRESRMAAAKNHFGKMQNLSQNMAAGGLSSVATGVAAEAPIVASVKEAMAFQAEMTTIAQKADLSRDAARLMGLELIKAAKAANQLPEALQAGVDDLAGKGLDPRKAIEMIAPIGRAATAYKAEIADLSSASFSAIDNLKVPIGETSRVLDVMAAAGKAGAFEVKDMATYFPSLTAAAQALGQKGVPAVADLAAALQITRKGTGDSAAAATNLQNLFQKMMSPDTVKNFKKFGVDLPNALKRAAAEGKSPIEAITELTNKALGGNDKKVGDLGRLGYIFSDSQVQQALRPLIQNIAEYRKIRATALNAKGVVDVDFAERMNDGAEAAKEFEVQQKALAVTMGTLLLPAATDFLKMVTGIAGAVSDWATRHPTLAKWLGITLAVVSGLLIVFGGFAIAIAGVLAPFAALTTIATALGISLLPLLGTVALIIGAIALLAGAAYLIYANWGSISSFFIRIWSTIKTEFGNGIGGISRLLMDFSPIGLLYSGFAIVMQWLGFDLPTRFSTFGANLMQGLISGITAKVTAIKSTIMSIGQSVAGWFRSVLGIHSPSRVFAGFGGNIVAGLNQGLDQRRMEPVQRMHSLSGKLVAAMAVGTAAPAMAAASPPAAPAATAGAGGGNTYVLHFHGMGSDKASDVAALVRLEIERLDSSRSARGRSSFRDNPDHED